MRLSALLLALVTDQPLTRDDRFEIAVLLLRLLRETSADPPARQQP